MVVHHEALEGVDGVEGEQHEEERVGEESSSSASGLCVEGSIIVADIFEMLN